MQDRDKIDLTDLTQISIIEIGTGVITGPKMGHNKQNFS